MSYTIEQLIKEDIVFMGADWQESEDAPEDSPIPGHVYAGEAPCVNCNDFFFWACGDAEEVTEETLPELNQAIVDCGGDLDNGSLLYCARRRGMRPQGAYYTYIKKDLWPLFDECGPVREVGFGNPCKPGSYRPENQRV